MSDLTLERVRVFAVSFRFTPAVAPPDIFRVCEVCKIYFCLSNRVLLSTPLARASFTQPHPASHKNTPDKNAPSAQENERSRPAGPAPPLVPDASPPAPRSTVVASSHHHHAETRHLLAISSTRATPPKGTKGCAPSPPPPPRRLATSLGSLLVVKSRRGQRRGHLLVLILHVLGLDARGQAPAIDLGPLLHKARGLGA